MSFSKFMEVLRDKCSCNSLPIELKEASNVVVFNEKVVVCSVWVYGGQAKIRRQ